MKLLTKEIEKKLPKLYTQENNPDPTAVVKFFDPSGGGTWYGIEGERQPDGDMLFFGYVKGLVPGGDELGYFSLNEIAGAKKDLPDWRRFLPIERDLWFKPTKLSALGIAR